MNRQAPHPISIPPPLQRHDGFVRFLQQHASPPHHRVTAGGRIVPAGPTSPPPMLDFDSLNGVVRERLSNVDMVQKEGRSVLSTSKAQNVQEQGTPLISYGNFGGYTSDQHDLLSGQPVCTASPMQPAAPYNGTQYNYQSLVAPTMQTPPVTVPIAVLSDGSSLISCNGANYRTYWNGLGTVMEPLQYWQQPTGLQLFAACPQTSSNLSQYGLPIHFAHGPGNTGPLTNITNDLRVPSSRKTSSSLFGPSVSGRETELKSQLTNLDKHLALYHYEITPAERTEMVAQRRYFVEALDKIRVSREKENRSIPIIAPHTGLPITPPTKSSTDQKADIRGADSHNKSTGKTLSPAALPFVPKGSWSGPFGLPQKRTFSDQSTQYGDSTASRRRANDEPNLKLKDMANTAIARKALNMYDLSGSIQLKSHEEGSSSSVLDPSDPAMRVIDYEDIEYASRYLFNWGLEKKTYCTTVTEFQEAIRRVRDQARRHGCFGGSSKDPAYDAEQDIWWAICDRDPIPLPAEVPDHFSNPRPWNWEDSAFNFRRKDAPLPPLTIDNARNSPRLSGWDSTTTENMKDTIDITRSYYALKGQLPNTPFRTWAFDNMGNKIEIGNPHALDHDLFRGLAGKEKPFSQAAHPALQCGSMNKVTSRPFDPDSANVLQPLSTNEINSGVKAARSKDGRKMNKTEGDAVAQFVVPTPKEPNSDFGRTQKKSSAIVNMASSTNVERCIGAIDSCQPYVEDCPGTPETHRSGSDRKRVPSPVKTTTNTSTTRHSGSKLQDVSPLKEVPTTKPTEFHMKPPQMILLESDMDPIWGGQYPIYDKRNPNYSKFPMDPPRKIGPFELTAETKSQWGPDEGSNSVPCSPGLNAVLKTHGNDETAKVNMPISAHNRPSVVGDNNCSGVQSNNVQGLVKLTADRSTESTNERSSIGSVSHQFLRKMLKSPTYSSTQPSKSISSTSLGIADRLSKLLRVGGDGAARATNKENASSTEKLIGTTNKASTRDGDQSDTASLFKSEPDALVSTASSSFTSSAHQAHDGAKKAHTTPFYQGNEAPERQVRVSLPSSASYAAMQDYVAPSTDNAAAGHHKSVNFGFDGGADPQSSTNDGSSKAAQKSHPNFDYKGVTAADYEIQRDSPNNE